MEISEFKRLRVVANIGKYKVKQPVEKRKRQCTRKGRMILLRKSKYMVCAWVSHRGNVKGLWKFTRPDTVKVQTVDSRCVVCNIK